jgi:hypothetical protein
MISKVMAFFLLGMGMHDVETPRFNIMEDRPYHQFEGREGKPISHQGSHFRR